MTKAVSAGIDFNPPGYAPLGVAINTLLDAAALIKEREARRDYLGASSIGAECLRKVQLDWQRDSKYAARTHRIFDRGHASEVKIATSLSDAGFVIERHTPATEFSTLNGRFRGHCDGILLSGPAIEGLVYPCLWENKCIRASGWNQIVKHGLKHAYPHYYDQVQIYMAYLALADNPCLFTAENADTCHLLALSIPFDADHAQAASDRAVSIVRATDAGELLPRITDKGPTDWRCKMCSHSAFCWSDEAEQAA